MSDYQFFQDMGVRVFENGHSFSGVHFSIHSKYSAIPAYEAAMQAAYGAERTAQILSLARHNTVYYPNLTIKGAIQSIRVVKPIAVDKTLIESWTFRLKGAPPELLQRIEANRQVVLRYTDPQGRMDGEWNPNGSVNAVAGLCNETRNVVGMMPHPERACETLLGGVDGRAVFESIVSAMAIR